MSYKLIEKLLAIFNESGFKEIGHNEKTLCLLIQILKTVITHIEYKFSVIIKYYCIF